MMNLFEHIAIIDDGINEKLYANINDLVHNIEITRELQVIQRVGYDPYLSSHGTTCAAIIKKYSPDASLSSIKVLNDTHRGLREQLIKAIEWCTENDIRLVNLSLGTIDYRDFEEIQKIVNKAYNKGLIIVAACNNKDIFTTPASLSNTIGVKCDKIGALKEDEYIYNHYPLDGIEITACGSHFLTNAYGESKYTHPSNSFAAPYITAKVSILVKNCKNTTLAEIKKRLFNSQQTPATKSVTNIYRNIDWIVQAIIFDISSNETSVPCCFPCAFEVKARINKYCISLVQGFEYTLEYFKNVSDDMIDVDTVILMLNGTYLDKSKELIASFTRCIQKLGKNLVFIDDTWKVKQINTEKSDYKVWYPPLIGNFYDKISYKKELEIPLTIIFDFSKFLNFDILLEIRDRFRSDGYYSIAISNKCTGILSGIEYIPEKDLLLNPEVIMSVLTSLEKTYNPDILIFGISIDIENFKIIESYIRLLNADIKIIVIDNYCESILTTIESKSISKDEFIVLRNYQEDNNHTNTVNNIFTEKKCVKSLYKYIKEKLQ